MDDVSICMTYRKFSELLKSANVVGALREIHSYRIPKHLESYLSLFRISYGYADYGGEMA